MQQVTASEERTGRRRTRDEDSDGGSIRSVSLSRSPQRADPATPFLANPQTVEVYSHQLSNSTNRIHYQYTPLDPTENEIRLVRVRVFKREVWCDLFVLSLDQASEQEYEALSYTWGGGSALAYIYLNGQKVLVRDNLKLALLQLGGKNGGMARVLWIDAICINQMDEGERSIQVSKMRNIYSKANTVRVWLGADSDGGELAFSLLHDIHGQRHDQGAILNMINSVERHESLRGLSALFSREYWWRVWVIQEVNVARKIVVHCGPHAMDWVNMIAVQQLLWEKFGSTMKRLSIKYVALQNLHQSVRFRGPQSLLAGRDPRHSQDLELFDALMVHRLKLSSDPRDRVFALVGLTTARDHPAFVIDYSLSVREVFINTADYIIRISQDLDVILAKTRGTERVDLPTWVPNWAAGPRQAIPYRHAVRHSKYSASGSRKSKAIISRQGGILSVHGTCLGSIRSIGPVSGMGSTDDYHQGINTFCTWYAYFGPTIESGENKVPFKYLARLLVCELSEPDEAMQQTLSDYLQKARRPNLKVLTDSMHKTISKAEQWMQSVSHMMFQRRPFVLLDGTMGMAEETILDGDLLCILFGCSIPVILRKVNDYYIYISDACAIDYMHGKGMGELEQGKFREEVFEIH